MVVKRKAVSPLTQKLIRDIKNGWMSFVAIWIICTLAVVLYVGIDASWRSIEDNLDKQFLQSNMADLWVKGAVSDRMVRDIEALEGVASAQRRATLDATGEKYEGEPNVLLIMNDGEPFINKPLLLNEHDTLPTAKNQCVLQQRFAQAHGLEKGDTLYVSYGDRQLAFTIAAIGYMPEYVVTSDGNEMATSPNRFGYAWVTSGSLESTGYTEIAVKLKNDADMKQVKYAIQAMYDDKQLAIIERDDVFGIKMAMEEAQQIRAMGAVFPFVFFVIAALITWTTMSRLVENQRLQIGSLFAVGYGRRELMWHFACYGILLAVISIITGFFGARFAIAPIILGFLRSAYFLPGAQPVISLEVFVVVSLLLSAITGGASLLSAVTALKLSPAALMRPKPPTKGKRVFIENITFLWKRFGFSTKMILRNMFRNRMRLIMGLIGAAGCTALMLTGFGLRDSVDYVMINHYTRTMNYDARVTLAADAPLRYGGSVALRAEAESYEEEMITSFEAFVNGEWRGKPVYVLDDAHEKICLYDDNFNRVYLPKDGITLTENAADDYGLSLGDTLYLRVPGGRQVAAEVNRIINLQLDQGIYMTASAFNKLDLIPFRPSSLLLSGDAMKLDTVKDMDGVVKVRTLQEERDNNLKTMNIMNLIVVVLVLFSGTLALVVFYNLGQLNFSERIRELATLKVLGFTPREIKKLVLRENILITLMGLPFGLLLGPLLLDAVLTYGLPNTIQFVPYVKLYSWLFTSALTVGFAMLVNWILGRKFKHVDMVEALKSVE